MPFTKGNPYRFEAGNRLAAAEHRKPTLEQALKAEMSFEWLAGQLRRIAGAPGRDQLAAVRYAMDRLAGAPRQMLTIEADADSPAVLLMRQIWSRLGGVEDFGSQSPAIDAEVRELPAGPVVSRLDGPGEPPDGHQPPQTGPPLSC